MQTSSLDDAVLAWLQRLATAEQPPQSVVAYNVGILETEDGYSAYLPGADAYDPEDAAVRKYLASIEAEGSFLAKSRVVTVGFDGGELLRVK